MKNCWIVVSTLFLTISCDQIVLAAQRDVAEATASQPAGEQTLLHFAIVEFTPKSSAVTASEIRRHLRTESGFPDIIRELEDLGRAAVLSRPSILVNWPQTVAVKIGRLVESATAGGTANVLEENNSHNARDIGVALSVEGQWLTVNRTKAYLQLGIDRADPPTFAAPDGSQVAERHFQKGCILTEDKATWIILPQIAPERLDRTCIVGIVAHRVRSPAPHARSFDPAPAGR